MVKQIPKLQSKYEEWINRPVDRPLRLFDCELLELLTKTPWWLVPLVWLPVISVIFYSGALDAFSKNNGTVSIHRSEEQISF